jgi:2',3'-cyclic-nucleotide 2'-phosphodiesterase/3'-nucleotidase
MLILGACLLLPLAAWAEEQVTLTVLFTSDMHAHVLPWDEVRQRPARGSIAQVASVVARVRAENPRTVVLDGGDAIEGTALGYYAIAAVGAKGPDPTIDAMNLVGYDAVVVGNHEFNFGLDVLRRSLEQSKFPWLAANVEGGRAVSLPIGDEVVIERGGVRVGVLGLITPNIPHWDPPGHWKGLSFTDPVEAARSRLPRLRARSDLVIVVLHSGFERDLDSGEEDDTAYENYAWRVAQLPGIDVLLTGHTHRDIAPRMVGGTLVAQPGRWAELVTRVDIDLAGSRTTWRVASRHGINIKTAGETADPAVVAAVEGARAHAEEVLGRAVGELAAPIRLRSLPTADDPAIDLIHAVQMEATGAQLSLAAPLGGNVEFPAGPVTARLVQGLYPYPNTLLAVRLTGTQLKDVLEHAVRGWKGLDCTHAPGCTLERDGRLPPYNYDTLQGATYLVDPVAPIGSRILGLRVAGRLVAAADTFTVAINSYRGAGGGGYPHLASAPRVGEIDRPMADLILDYIARHKTITPAADENWAFVVPLREAVMEKPAATH